MRNGISLLPPWKLFSFSADICIIYTCNQVWRFQVILSLGHRSGLKFRFFYIHGHLTISFLTTATWMKKKKQLLWRWEGQRQQVKISRWWFHSDMAVKITTQCYEEDEINVHNRAHSSMATRTSLHFPPSPQSFHRLSPHLWSLTFLHLTMQLECPSHLKHPDTFQM